MAANYSITDFNEIKGLTPEGCYHFEIFETSFCLEATHCYQVDYGSVIGLYVMPKRDGVNHRSYFVIAVNPPITKGDCPYSHIVFELQLDDEISIKLTVSVASNNEYFGGRLKEEYKGPIAEVVPILFSDLTGLVITAPTNFVGRDVGYSVHTSVHHIDQKKYPFIDGFMHDGSLYPLDQGLLFLPKPATHIVFHQIESVEPVGPNSHYFNMHFKLRDGQVHIFRYIGLDELVSVSNFLRNHNVTVFDHRKADDKLHSLEAEPPIYDEEYTPPNMNGRDRLITGNMKNLSLEDLRDAFANMGVVDVYEQTMRLPGVGRTRMGMIQFNHPLRAKEAQSIFSHRFVNGVKLELEFLP